MSTDGAHTCCDCGDEEIKRLRRRVHEVVDETQRRYAKYQSRCDRFDAWAEWCKRTSGPDSSTWEYRSQADREFILGLTEERDAVLDALADCVVKATEYGTQDGGFVAHYISPTGPIHRAIPLLERHGITVRPGFDGRPKPEGGES